MARLGSPLSGAHGERVNVHRVAATADQSRNTLRAPLHPVACLRFDDACFLSGTSFVLPRARPFLMLLHDMMEQREGTSLALFGHAAPSGDIDANKALSGRRALAILGVLAHRFDLWDRLRGTPAGSDVWDPTAARSMADALSPASGADSGRTDAKALDAPAWSALCRDYVEMLTRDASGAAVALGPERFLGRLADPDLRVDAQGCSEFNPVMVPSRDEVEAFARAGHDVQRRGESAGNGRVLALLFPHDAQVTPSEWPCPRATDGAATCHGRFWSDAQSRVAPADARRTFEVTRDTMACRFYHRFVDRSPCERNLPLMGLHIRLVDLDHNPKKAEPYRLRIGDLVFDGETGPNGELVHAIPADARSGELEFGGLTRTLTIVAPTDAADNEGGSMRLQNLVFGRGSAGTLAGRIAAVQRFLTKESLPLSETLDSAAIMALRKRYGA